MCCLKYENHCYTCFKKNLPTIGKKVNVNGINGKVISVDVLRKKYKVELEKKLFEEYNEVIENPFRGSKSKVLRLEENKIKLITDLPIISYTMTYLSNPSPIILVDLPNGLTINNESKKSTTIETSESIHREILDKAVQLAIQSKTLLKSST